MGGIDLVMTDLIIAKIENKFKVPERVADQVKVIAEKIGNSYVLYESRPAWDDNSKPWTKFEVAKMLFIKRRKIWKLFWKRASGKWELYGEYKSFGTTLNSIEKDVHGCFWG